MICALAFVPVDDVEKVFDLFKEQEELPEVFRIKVVPYFERTYVHVKKARGRAKAVAVRYAPVLWSHYQAVLDGTARTNNASEGWHNWFPVIVGKNHPSLHTFLKELQHEQSDTETLLRQMKLG
uniref:Uncharacterized protein n=1 Tax=Trichogramma kaykai TaxID=54128 RepID=A0ABD2XQX2_9HYME